MDKKTGIIIAILILIFGGLIGVTILQKNSPSYDYAAFDRNSVIAADDANGGFGDIIEGNPDAPVKLIEYGNYQCTACAALNEKVNELIESYDGKVALVYRVMSLPEHDNGKASASAALAAYNQGYWKEYKDLLYKNQSEWYYATGTDRQLMFETYLLTVSDGKADLAKFREDMTSAEVAQKITFDDKLADLVNAEWSPYFVLDGENVSQKGVTGEFIDKLKEEIDKKLEGLGAEE